MQPSSEITSGVYQNCEAAILIPFLFLVVECLGAKTLKGQSNHKLCFCVTSMVNQQQIRNRKVLSGAALQAETAARILG